LSNPWTKTAAMIANAGVRGATGFLCKERFWRFARLVATPAFKGWTYQLRSRFSPGPVFVRAGSSDRRAFRQVLLNLEYDCFHNLRGPRLIVDCGANVGYASLFFLGRYPSAHVIAIEPEPDNFALLRRNTAPYGERVTAIQSGVWSHATGLTIRRGEFGDGREWATQVSETPPGQTPDIRAVDLAGVLLASGFPRIDILKVDIERAEMELFARGTEHWLSRVDNLVIELHGPDCEKVLFDAARVRDYKLSRRGELTILEDLRARDSEPRAQRPRDD
jgi:FkbM family methyltransferase